MQVHGLGAVKIADKQSDAVAYLYEYSRVGKPAAIMFAGKSDKPYVREYYRDESRRAEAVAGFFAGRREALQRKAERQAEKRAPHTLNVGDILHTSWGYEQTNVEFFEITRLISARMVEIREIAQERKETGHMQGTCKPIAGRFIGEPLRRFASATNSVKIDDVRHAYPGRSELSWSNYH